MARRLYFQFGQMIASYLCGHLHPPRGCLRLALTTYCTERGQITFLRSSLYRQPINLVISPGVRATQMVPLSVWLKSSLHLHWVHVEIHRIWSDRRVSSGRDCWCLCLEVRTCVLSACRSLLIRSDWGCRVQSFWWDQDVFDVQVWLCCFWYSNLTVLVYCIKYANIFMGSSSRGKLAGGVAGSEAEESRVLRSWPSGSASLYPLMPSPVAYGNHSYIYAHLFLPIIHSYAHLQAFIHMQLRLFITCASQHYSDTKVFTPFIPAYKIHLLTTHNSIVPHYSCVCYNCIRWWWQHPRGWPRASRASICMESITSLASGTKMERNFVLSVVCPRIARQIVVGKAMQHTHTHTHTHARTHTH